nr:uncharacterized mitochondrial protein AtMg00810-like [Tanacetum cinerariifolium]
MKLMFLVPLVDALLSSNPRPILQLASTPIDTEKPLLKDPDGEDVDVRTYRSMIGSLMYLTSSRPDIMFAVCACVRFQVTPKASRLHEVKRIFRYLKGKPYLGLWYPKDLPFDLVAYSDSDYAGASLDRKSTTGGCCSKWYGVFEKDVTCYNILSDGYLTTQQMVLNSPCLTHIKNWLVQIKWSLSWLVQKQTSLGKDKANPLIVDSLLKTIWSSIHHLLINEVLTIPGQTETGVNTPRSDEHRLELIDLTVFLLQKVEKVGIGVSVVDLQVFAVRLMLLLLVQKFLLFGLTNWCCSLSAVSSIKYALTVNPNIYVSCIKQFWTTVAVKKVNDVIRLQALFDKKKVVVTEATIRDALRLDDKGVEVFLTRKSLQINPNIYVSCIKQFWTIVAVKKVNDVIRLQALVDKKKVVVTKATIRDALYLDVTEGVECLPNEEIFVELARMGYEKPSTKLTSSMASAVICLSSGRKFNFSKYIFDSLVRNVDSPTKFYMYPRFLQLMIGKQVCDLLTDTTKYTSLALTQKVFANIRRVGKGFSGVDTPLFEGMLVAQEVVEEGDADENDKTVNAGDTAVGDPSHDILSTSQAQPTPPQSHQVQPQSPQPQPQPQQDVGLPMNLLQEVMDTCTTLSRRVEHLELDKIAQALEITKLKRMGKKLERRNKVKVLKLRKLQKVGTSQRVETSNETMMDNVSNQERMIADIDADADVVLEEVKEVAADAKADQEEAKVNKSVDIQGRTTESQREIYKIDLDHANKVLSMQEDESEPDKVQEVVDVVTTAKIITEVVTAASETITAASITITAAEAQVLAVTLTTAPARVTAASNKGKGILVEEPKPLKKQQQIKQDEKYARELEAELNKNIYWDEAIDHVNKKAKEDNVVKRYQAIKRKPQTEAQARKNMMVYLKNVVGFKMDYFKGTSYDDIRPIFERYFGSNVAFLLNNKPYYKIIRANVKRKYLLTRFTLDQMLNAVRLEVDEESEVSLELLRFTQQQHQEGQLE